VPPVELWRRAVVGRVAQVEEVRSRLAVRESAASALIDRSPPAVAAALADHARAALASGAPSLPTAVLEQAVVAGPAGACIVVACPALTDDRVRAFSSAELFERAVPATPGVGARTARALEMIAALEGLDFVTHVFGLLVLTADCHADRIVHASHADLVGTIFSNAIEDDVRFGEMLVHETAHSTLTLAARSVGERFESTERFWSPWRGRPRPLALHLQGVYAFSMVARYLQRVLDARLAPAGRRRIVARKLTEVGGHLAEAAPHAQAALRLVDADLREMVAGALAGACASGRSAG